MKRSVYTIGSLIILLIAAFIFVLVPIFAGGHKQTRLPAFGKYDGTEIRYEQNSDFANYVARYADYYKNNGIEINNSNYYYIFSYAFNTTVSQLAFQKAVKNSGYKVPKTAVNRSLMGYFTDESGNYSSKLYKLAVKDRPSQVEQLRAEIETTLTTQRYAEDSFGGQTAFGKTTLYGLKNSEKETAFITAMGENQKSFDAAVFNMNEYPESEKVAFGKNNAEKFVKYDFSVITVADKAKAASVAKRVNNGEITFADAVSEYSTKSYSTDSGKINNKYHYQIEKFLTNKEDMAKIASLEPDAVSEPLQTSVGYSIFKADSAAVQPDFKDSAVISTVYNYLTSNEFSVIEEYYTKRAGELAAAAKTGSFAAACTKFNAKKVDVPAFPVNYGDMSVMNKLNTSLEGLSGASTNQAFLKAVNGLKNAGDVSEPIVNNRNVVVLKLLKSNVKPSDPIPAEALHSELSNYDTSSAQEALLSSPKLENNLSEVFFKYMMNND